VRWFLGIDGGGTRTRAFLVEEDGAVGAQAEAGLSNLNHASNEEVRTHLATAINGACRQAGVEPAACHSAFLGMAGVTTESARAAFRALALACGLRHAQVGVDHDIRIALAGGLGGQPGVALIVGTGSSCYGRTAEGRTWQTGGWEALISDEGSGYFLGREAIAAAARMADGRAPETPLKARVFAWLRIDRIADILPRLHDQGLSRSDIAAFAPQLIALADQGDDAAREILQRGAGLLAELVVANHRQLPTGPGPEVVITGGLGTAPTAYQDLIRSAILAQLPEARLHLPLLPAVVGAAMLAMEQAGVALTSDRLQKLRSLVT
jgi:N-acetylglucosamine kinase-like BadF-type ATPase